MVKTFNSGFFRTILKKGRNVAICDLCCMYQSSPNPFIVVTTSGLMYSGVPTGCRIGGDFGPIGMQATWQHGGNRAISGHRPDVEECA